MPRPPSRGVPPYGGGGSLSKSDQRRRCGQRERAHRAVSSFARRALLIQRPLEPVERFLPRLLQLARARARGAADGLGARLGLEQTAREARRRLVGSPVEV